MRGHQPGAAGGLPRNPPHIPGGSSVIPTGTGGTMFLPKQGGTGQLNAAGPSALPAVMYGRLVPVQSVGGGPAPHVESGAHPSVAQPPSTAYNSTIALYGGGVPGAQVPRQGSQLVLPTVNTFSGAAGLADQPRYQHQAAYVAPKPYGY